MRKYMLLSLITVSVLLVSACAPQAQQPAAPPQPEFKTTATVKDIMDAVVDPAADVVWGAVETIVSAKGVEERFPRNDEEWKHVRRNAIMLLEASNLLKIPGRDVAKPGETSENPGIELAPEQIRELIDKDRVSWNNYATALHDATVDALKSIDAKDPEALLNMGDGIYQACEMCHMQYWYPEDRAPGTPTIEKKGSN